ncbi:hypothetical protein [Actinokineospora iranica]|uniref:Uncharacterized protein n=1 Tax=Actinokineospora iranica TaxID=1271860 RepID=A0A1G6K903_9PSEU|nr:hypothetical protein [Actinokineospora iranica]SDC27311.1 hypothetical protein SAMN05216174_101775 [Actinokineospora iranica]
MAYVLITEASAVSRFPELRDLLAAGEGRWRFHLLSENDDSFGVAASRRHTTHTDGVFVLGRGQVLGMRVVLDAGGGIGWMKHGADIVGIARELVKLSAPGEPWAPDVLLPVDALLTDPSGNRIRPVGPVLGGAV